MFFGFAGCQGNIPSILAYQSNNIRTQSKRSVASALIIGMGKSYSLPERLELIALGGLGGIMGSTVFVQREAPRYLTGLWVTTGLQLLVIVLVSCTSTYFYFMNKKVDAGTLRTPLEGLEGFKFTL